MRVAHLRSSLTGAMCLLALASTGCGLVFVPRVQVFPGEVRGIRAVDAQDGRDLPHAAVACEVWRYDNWLHPMPHLMEADLAHSLNERDSELYRQLEVKRDTDGVFRVEQCRTIGWMQWFFPLPLPLGWTLYHDYVARITVRAPGHCGLVLTYAPEDPPTAGWTDRTPCGHCRLAADGVLEFLLSKADAPGAASLSPARDG